MRPIRKTIDIINKHLTLGMKTDPKNTARHHISEMDNYINIIRNEKKIENLELRTIIIKTIADYIHNHLPKIKSYIERFADREIKEQFRQSYESLNLAYSRL